MTKVDIAKIMRKAGMPITNEKLEFRKEGIEAYIGGECLDEKGIGLVQIYYTGTCDKEVFDDLVSVFKEVDAVFSEDLVNEIQILAGLILCEMTLRNKWTDAVELAEMYFMVYDFLGYKSVSEDIYQLICDDFDKRRIDFREEISFGETELAELEEDVIFDVPEGGSAKYDETVIGNLNVLANTVRELVREINNVSVVESVHAQILYEDSQLLWWLLTGVADDSGDKYSKLDPKAAAVMAGKDLAGRVSLFPGPYAVRSLILKALDFADTQHAFPFEEYIEAVDDNVTSRFVDEEAEIDTPILYALKKKAENGSGNWKGVFSKHFAKSKTGYTVTDIALEVYFECMILQRRAEMGC